MKKLALLLLLLLPSTAFAATPVFLAATYGTASGSATSISWTGPTCSGSNLYGVVEVLGATTDNMTTVTWNGVNAPQIAKKKGDGFNYIYLYGVANPASASTIVVNGSPAGLIEPGAACYSGANQNNTPDTSITGGGSNSLGSSYTATSSASQAANVTLVALIAGSSTGVVTSCSVGTLEASNSSDLTFVDRSVAASGSNNLTCVIAGTNNIADIVISLASPSTVSTPMWMEF